MRSYGFEVNKLIADLTGASNAYITVVESMDITASGASNVHYKGEAVIISQELSGGSNIIKED